MVIQCIAQLNGHGWDRVLLLIFLEYQTTSNITELKNFKNLMKSSYMCDDAFIFYFRVTVIVKRVGGAYGAKAFFSTPVAAACALAAYVTQRY